MTNAVYGPREATWKDVQEVHQRTQRIYRSQASSWTKFLAGSAFEATYWAACRTTARETNRTIERNRERAQAQDPRSYEAAKAALAQNQPLPRNPANASFTSVVGPEPTSRTPQTPQTLSAKRKRSR